MLLKLKHCIRNNGVKYKSGTVIDTKELGLEDAQVTVLIKSGAAVAFEEKAGAVTEAYPAGNAPEVTMLAEVEGTLAGAVTEAGKTVALAEMTKAELVAIAKDMEIEGVSGMTKAELVAAIEAVKVSVEG